MQNNTDSINDDDIDVVVVTLSTLIRAYASTRANSHSECQRVRLTEVIVQLATLADEYDVSFRRADNPDDPLVVVCFFHAPISRWGDQTYATCLSSLITTFFNPHCVLPSSKLTATLGPDETPVISDEEVDQLQFLFGGVLKYIHEENAKLAPYMDQLQAYFYPGRKAWHRCNPRGVYTRVLGMWRTGLGDIARMGKSRDDKPMLFEAIMNRDAELLGRGLKKFSANQDPERPFPWVMTLALMQYQRSRQNALAHEMVLRTMQLTKAEEEAEAERKKNGDHGCDDLDSLETQIQQTVARRMEQEKNADESVIVTQ